MAGVVEWLKRLAKAYGAFAVAHMLFKLVAYLAKVRRAAKCFKHLPGRGFGAQFDYLGTEVMANFHNYFDWRSKEMLKHGEKSDALWVTGQGPLVELVCNKPAAVKHILKDDFNSFTKPGQVDDYLLVMLKDFLGGHGIFVLQHGKDTGDPSLEAQHATWFNQRKTATKIFTKSAFSSLVLETFTKNAKTFKSVLHKSGGKPMDVQVPFFRFTMDSIQKIFFGRDIDTLSGKEDDAYAKAFDNAHEAMVKTYLGYVPVHIAAQLFLPFPFGTLGNSNGNSLTMDAVRAFTKDGRKFSKNTVFLQEQSKRFVAEARKDPNLAKRRDLLANFLNSDKNLSDQELVDIVLNFIIAGRDTTACTLTWLFFELSINPEHQQKCFEEIKREVPTDEDTSYEKMGHCLVYLRACVLETLRMHPPVPEDSKVNTANDSVAPDGTIIPKGTKVTFSNFMMGRSEAFYPNPLKFDPTRWIEPDGSLKKLDAYYTPVFQSGPRQCAGQLFALLEITTLSSMLLRDFEFSMDPEEAAKITYSLMITMSVANSPDRNSHDVLLSAKPRVAAA